MWLTVSYCKMERGAAEARQEEEEEEAAGDDVPFFFSPFPSAAEPSGRGARNVFVGLHALAVAAVPKKTAHKYLVNSFLP